MFYEREDVSSEMPGQGDTKSVNIDGTKKTFQKRLILGNLKQIYSKFKNENLDVKIGLSKFCSLRPVHCILAGSGGTHNVCVCPIHENVNLMAKGSHIVKLMKENFGVTNYRDVLLLPLCLNPKEQCFFGECENCKKNTLVKIIEDVFRKNDIKEVSYKHWVSQPRTTLETVKIPVEQFIRNFEASRKPFLVHSFITDQQATFYRFTKKHLQDDQSLVVCDFAENYAFVVQNAVPGFHWNNNQATIFPMVFYYNDNGTIKHKTLVMISDCSKHDSIAVYMFLKIFNEFLSHFRPIIKNCIYFSDGAPQQFKNSKHFSTIYNHEQDFDRSAVWHFSATAHGKGPCDGAGGAFKRKAKKASLQMTSNDQITTALELYEWAQRDSSESNISVFYTNKESYDETAQFLKQRFDNCKTIPGTQKIHCVEPMSDCRLKIKIYSRCPAFRTVSFSASRNKKRV